MIDYRTYPRVTGSLRAHSNIAERLHYRSDIDELQRRREKVSTKTLSWNELQQMILEHNTNPTTINTQLKQLRKFAIEFGWLTIFIILYKNMNFSSSWF